MDRVKNENVTILTPKTRGKSWVASRFVVVETAGIAKRRCTFNGCTQEYARGTSHIKLRRHWSKVHDDQFSESTSNLVRSTVANKRSPTPKKRKSVSTLNNGSSVPIKTKLGSSDLAFNHSGHKSLNSGEKGLLDIKLVAKRLKEATSIHLTFDIYTAKKGAKSYGIITAHSPDALDIKSVLLDYRHMPFPDDSTTIYESLRSCITKFNIREKIVSIASGSSAAVETAIQELDKRYRLSKNFNFATVHVKCFPQFVHLNVIEILKSQEALIESVRKVISFINSNNFTLRPLQQGGADGATEAVLANNLSDDNNTHGSSEPGVKATGLKLPYDNRGNWNTTYTMIEIFIQQKAFIEPTLLYFQSPQELPSLMIDWDRLYMLIQLLKPFYDVINKFSSDNYSPVSLVAVCIPHLMDHLADSSWAYDDLVMAAHNFKLNLETYRQQFQSDLTVAAGLLDPRVKDSFLSTEGRDEAIDILRKRLDSSNQNKTEANNKFQTDSLWSRIFRNCNYDEITDYLESPREHGSASSFAFWETHKHVYPGLYNLAIMFVCVQASSVSSDRMFSAAENAERERRIQVESTNSKELMKSWAKYLEK